MNFNEAKNMLANSGNSIAVQKGQLGYGLYYAPEVTLLLDKLKATYEPTVFMTNDEIEVFQHYLYGVGSLRELLDYKVAPKRLEDGNFSELSEEDLASAWLNPSSVELMEEEED